MAEALVVVMCVLAILIAHESNGYKNEVTARRKHRDEIEAVIRKLPAPLPTEDDTNG
jgi:hypothetical protein